MSPEVISGADYDFKFDIWSLGISLIEIVQGHLPFGEVNIMRVNEIINPFHFIPNCFYID